MNNSTNLSNGYATVTVNIITNVVMILFIYSSLFIVHYTCAVIASFALNDFIRLTNNTISGNKLAMIAIDVDEDNDDVIIV